MWPNLYQTSRQTRSWQPSWMRMTKIYIEIHMRAPNVFFEVGQANQTSHIKHDYNSDVSCFLIGCLMDFKFCQTRSNTEIASNNVAKRQRVWSSVKHVWSCFVTKHFKFDRDLTWLPNQLKCRIIPLDQFCVFSLHCRHERWRVGRLWERWLYGWRSGGRSGFWY